MGRSGKGGFTSVEVTVTIAIMVAVSVMLTAGARHATAKAKMDRAKAEILALDDSLSRYIAKRGQVPCDTDADGIVSEPEIVMQLAQWGLLGNLKPNASGNVIDPWENAYVIVLSRDYEMRVADVLSDDLGRPYNDLPDGFQIYCKELKSEAFRSDLANLSNIVPSSVHIADAGTDGTMPTDPTLPTDPTDPIDPTDPTTPGGPADPADPTDPTGPTGPTAAQIAAARSLINEADGLMMQADAKHARAVDCASLNQYGLAATYGSLAANYADDAAYLARDAAATDPAWTTKANLYTAKAAQYAADAAVWETDN